MALGITVLSFAYLFFVMANQAKGFEVPKGTNFLGTSFGFSQQSVLAFLSARNIEQLQAYTKLNTK